MPHNRSSRASRVTHFGRDRGRRHRPSSGRSDVRSVDHSTSVVQVPVRCRPALLGQACARAAQATEPLSPAAPLLSVDRCALAGTAFDVAAAMLERSSTLRAPRPDLLYRSGRGAFQRLQACLTEGGRAFRCDGVCGRYAAHSRARSELDTMSSIPNYDVTRTVVSLRSGPAAYGLWWRAAAGPGGTLAT